MRDTRINFAQQITPYGCNWEESHPGVEGFAIHGVEEEASLLGIDERPEALGLLNHLGEGDNIMIDITSP